MRLKMMMTVVVAVSIVSGGFALANGGATIQVGVDASVWDSAVMEDAVAGIFPVGGSGQLNGEFTTAERDGVQIGLRATDRVDGLLLASGKKKGLYVAKTGFDTGTTNRAEWNYDIHVDLRDSGTTLGDYTLTLTQTFAPSLYDQTGPLDLTFGGFFPDHTVLYQQSWNPVFGNDTFDPTVEGTYNLKLTLKPKGKGKPLSVEIQVKVKDA